MCPHARLLVLPLLLVCATPSYGQQAPRDTLVCFTLEQAGLLHDTLWSGVSHRRARVLQAALIGTLRQQLQACEGREVLERQRADANARAIGVPCDSSEWERKARQRWRYLVAGVVVGAVGTIIVRP